MAGLRILQVNTADALGGAESVMMALHAGYRARGHDSRVAVGFRRGDVPEVIELRSDPLRGGWARLWIALAAVATNQPGRRAAITALGQPRRAVRTWLGREDFDFPATRRLLARAAGDLDVVQFHNLHGGYFDLRALGWISHRVPTMLTLHDGWLLSGHCAHSFDCERWTIGCGACPDLSIYPAVQRDATAANWRAKRRIYAESRLHVATPSTWLKRRVERSMLAPGLADLRVIHNGVDRSVFRPADRAAARIRLGLPPDTRILLFSGFGVKRNPWKDYPTMRAAVERVASQLDGRRLIYLALGEDGPSERIGSAELRFVGFHSQPADVARYYQAADVYLHAARADTFPTTVIEALACGRPVVATAVGGIPEQVRGLAGAFDDALNRYNAEAATGVLTPTGDSASLAAALLTLLRDDVVRARLGENAARDAAERFDLERQIDAYLTWYGEAREIWQRRGEPAGA